MEKPKNLISYKILKKNLENYKKGISSHNPHQTQSMWLSLQDLKEYISFIEENAQIKEIPISGIRFHLTANDEKIGKINMALCPTFESKAEDDITKQISFDPIYSEKRNPKRLTDLITNEIPDVEVSSVLNNIKTCPPEC